MEITQLSESFFVCAQLNCSDLPSLKQRGFASIICNRPDGETADQENFARIEEQAAALDMQAVQLAMANADISEDLLKRFEQTYVQLPKPILAYCRTGNRSSLLWKAFSGQNS